MANKYIIHGATYCGDGTASNEAASAGASGAWNDAFAVLENTAPAYGALAARDTIFIRSKTSGGADLSKTLTASISLGSSSATTAATAVTWVLDGGTIWAGVAGSLTYLCPSTYIATFRGYNRFISENPDGIIIREMNTAPNYKKYLGGASIYLKNVFCDFGTTVLSGGNGSQITAFTEHSVLENLHVTSRKIPERLILCGEYGSLTLINPTIELITATANVPVFSNGGTGLLLVIGGSISGAGATSAVPLTLAGQGQRFEFYGFTFPNEMPLALSAITFFETSVKANGSDNLCGSRIMEKWGYASSRTDAYYPTLSAQLPDSNGHKWSWWLYPTGTTLIYSAELEFGKVFTENDAAKVITLELLVGTLFSAVNAGTVWASLVYTDTTGVTKFLNSLDVTNSALATSSAAWYPDPPTYGATAYDKKKIVFTTPTAIKKDTLIYVTLFCTATATLATHSIIVCPDFVVATP